MADRARQVGNMSDPNSIKINSSQCVDLGIIKFYLLATAITTAVTAVPDGTVAGLPIAVVGDLARTSHATGGGANVYMNVAGVWTAI